MKKILLLSFIILNSLFGFGQNDSKELISLETCGNLYGSLGEGSETGRKFERNILYQLGFELNVKNKEMIVCDFLNKNAKVLICETNDDVDSVRRREQILKKCVGIQYNGLFSYMEKNGKYKGKIDFNVYEIIDDKKETLLDYVLKIYNNEELLEEYDEDEIVDLIRIIKLFGGKKGEEL